MPCGKDQRRLARLFEDKRKETAITPLTTCYNQGIQKSMSECTIILEAGGVQQQRTTIGVTHVS